MNTKPLVETSLPTLLIDDLRNFHKIETVGMLRAIMKADPNMFTRYLLQFQLDYDEVLKELESCL